MLNQTRDYFIVFDKRGFVFYETGPAPCFINDLILSMDKNSVQQSRKVRDKWCETKTEGDKVFLCFSNNKDHLYAHIEKYKTVIKEKEMQIKKTEGYLHGLTRSFAHKAFSLFTKKIKIEDLEVVMRERLISKNVEPNFSDILVKDLVGVFKAQEKEWITEEEFKTVGQQTFNKILPSINHEQLLKSIKAAKENNQVFSFCFVGVNGVGKSTSLAKMTRWLLENGFSVFIAACDTFRAGAVEQLKVHVDKFVGAGQKVGFYESGYNKDDASVAKSAIDKAYNTGYDVVLIDTAGRMHGNKVLMSSLSKIIRVNDPTHIIYVGEALAGNDSLDFIKEFNKAVKEGKENRKIDSIILTKIDTVGDKIGQIFNLTFKTSSPILFLGCGQTNADLIEMNGCEIAQLLLN